MEGESTESIYRQADMLIDLGKAEKALPMLGAGITRDPDALRLHALRALALLQLNREHEALEAARKAIHLDPEEEWGHRLQALALMRMHRHEEALKSALEAARCDPYEEGVKYTVAQSAYMCGRSELALQWGRDAARDFPEDSKCHTLLGAIFTNLRQYSESEASFRKALELNPENHYALRQLGELLCSRGRKDEGIELLFRAARQDPGDDEMQSELYNTATGGCFPNLVAVVGAVVLVIVLGRTPGFTSPVNWIVGIAIPYAAHTLWSNYTLRRKSPEVQQFCREYGSLWLKYLMGDVRACFSDRNRFVQALGNACLLLGAVGICVVSVMWMSTGKDYSPAWFGFLTMLLASIPLYWLHRLLN